MFRDKKLIMGIIYCFLFGSVAKHLESANTMFSFIWWIIGFYWVSSGGPDLTAESPQLYWCGQVIFVDSARIMACFLVLFMYYQWCILQAFHCILGIRCFLRCGLCCCGMYNWNCCLLLSTMYHCNLICSCRSGKFNIESRAHACLWWLLVVCFNDDFNTKIKQKSCESKGKEQ